MPKPYDNLKKPKLSSPHNWKPGEDEVRYLTTHEPNKNNRVGFLRPWLQIPGTKKGFVWPMGIEGFSINGSAQVHEHKGLGMLKVDWTQTHRDMQTISMSGTFPGKTSTDHMGRLMGIARAKTPGKGKELFLPGLFFGKPLLVVVKDYNFTRETGRGSGINYSITFLRVGIRPDKEATPKIIAAKPVGQKPRGSKPGKGNPNKGKDSDFHIFTVRPPFRTLMRISLKFYGNTSGWRKIHKQNQGNKYFRRQFADVPKPKHGSARLKDGLKVKV